MKISDKTIEFLKDFITGDNEVLSYKSGPKLVDFFGKYGCIDNYGQGFPSRWYYVQEKLKELNGTKQIEDIILDVFDTRNFIGEDEKYTTLLDILDEYLRYDGYKTSFKNGKLIIISISDNLLSLENGKKIGIEYAREQLAKIDDRFSQNDFSGAISACFSLIQTTIGEIYKNIIGEEIGKGGSLKDSYGKIRNLLNLNGNAGNNDNINKILSGLNLIVDGLDNLCNEMGDRHTRPIEPKAHHARLVINSTKTFIDFLYDTLEYQS